MPGQLSDEARAMLDDGLVYVGAFLELNFGTGVERYWNGYDVIEWDGVEWYPTGNLATISPIESSEDFHANGLTLTLGGLPGDAPRNASLLSAADYKGKAARFSLNFMNSTFSTVVHDHQRFYTMDKVDYVVDPEQGALVEVALETETRTASRKSVRRYTDQDQKTDYPDDQAFEFVPFINSGIDVRWGTGGAFFKS